MKYSSLEQRVNAAKNDVTEQEDLIREYMPFIRKKATEVIPPNKFDQHSSAAMEAFTEAIKAFDEDKGKFLSFASIVIKRRVTDQIRREYRLGEKSVEDIEVSTNIEDESERAIEINVFRKELLGYGIKMTELPSSSPKHKASKIKTDIAAQTIANSKEMMGVLIKTGKLPVTRLSQESGTPIKLIEKKRKYIIARALLLQNKYGYLKEYIR